jgi:two-component system cell cycle sensor histidine kinase/response regulator CckA
LGGERSLAEPHPKAPAPFASIESTDARLKALSRTVATLDDAVFVIDATDRTVLSCNEAVETLFGYRPQEVLGGTTELFYESHESFEAFAELAVPALEQTGAFRCEYRLRRKDGTVFPSPHTVTTIEETEGLGGRVVAVIRDLTRIQEAVEALRVSEEREGRVQNRLERRERYYRALIESSQDIVTVLDPDGNFRYSSPAVETWLGYRPDELVGTRAFDLVHPEDRAPLERLFVEEVREPGQRASVELRIRTRDGAWRRLQAWAVNLIEDPVIRGVIVHSRDVTDQRAMEETLRKNREHLLFAEKMESLGRMAGGIVHDFRNWLFLVAAHSEILAAAVDGALRDSVREIQRATEEASGLVEQLSTFSNRPLGKPEVLDVGAVLQRLEPALARMTGKNIDLVLRCPQEPAPVKTDRGQLQQMVFNLVNNAVDAMEGRGTLTIEVQRVALEPWEEEPARIGGAGTYVKLVFEDTGPGIDEATRNRIFEPFFTTKSTGTGLGLANVYAVVRDLGGFIDVRSRAARGTRFELFLPRAELAHGGD